MAFPREHEKSPEMNMETKPNETPSEPSRPKFEKLSEEVKAHLRRVLPVIWKRQEAAAQKADSSE
jgi:hypothetical protein